MREIKFRAWDEKDKKFKDLKFAFPDMMTGRNLNNTEGVILMQYTGLKDKNGVEIYEGDIIQTQDVDNWDVIFHNGCFCHKEIDNQYHIFNEKEVEVIGNIYENPELIQ